MHGHADLSMDLWLVAEIQVAAAVPAIAPPLLAAATPLARLLTHAPLAGSDGGSCRRSHLFSRGAEQQVGRQQSPGADGVLQWVHRSGGQSPQGDSDPGRQAWQRCTARGGGQSLAACQQQLRDLHAASDAIARSAGLSEDWHAPRVCCAAYLLEDHLHDLDNGVDQVPDEIFGDGLVHLQLGSMQGMCLGSC